MRNEKDNTDALDSLRRALVSLLEFRTEAEESNDEFRDVYRSYLRKIKSVANELLPEDKKEIDVDFLVKKKLVQMTVQFGELRLDLIHVLSEGESPYAMIPVLEKLVDIQRYRVNFCFCNEYNWVTVLKKYHFVTFLGKVEICKDETSSSVYIASVLDQKEIELLNELGYAEAISFLHEIDLAHISRGRLNISRVYTHKEWVEKYSGLGKK